MVTDIFISDLAPKTKDQSLLKFFPGAVVDLDFAPNGRYLHSAKLSFPDVDALQEGLNQSGVELDKRLVLISVMENEEKVPLYLKVEELAPHAKEAHVRAQFGVVTKRVPIV
ncbi:hypothetical protein Tco_1352850 [Tanacetum coccineum]